MAVVGAHPGEQVDTLTGPVAVASVEQLESPLDVHNIEVHGEHVFRVTADGVLVHNAGPGTCVAESLLNGVRNLPEELGLSPSIQRAILRAALKADGTDLVAHHLIPLESLTKFRDLMTRAARGGFDINGAGNGTLLKQWIEHWGSHPGYNSAVMDHLGRISQLVKQRRLGDAAVAELMHDTARTLAEAIHTGSFMPMF
ncbi:MAG: AHH domain-containing protein [Planctomycetaceae bacterium]